MKGNRFPPRPVTCLEATWFKEKSVSVQPYLETLRTLEGVPFVRYPCDTIQDLIHILSKPVGQRGILYIAMHGYRGILAFGSRTKEFATLDDLADTMGERYENWHVHIASCATLNVTQNQFNRFKRKTKVDLVSGYTKYVDWIEGYAMDMLLLLNAQKYKRSHYLVRYMYEKYGGLIANTGMYME